MSAFTEFVKLCERGETLEAIARFYAEDVIVYENRERARVGRAACLAFEEAGLARLPEPPTLRARAAAEDPREGVSFIEWTLRYVSPDGRPMRMDEVAVQRWRGDEVVEERFYYEGVIDEGEA
jgi:ketosteroid isomerase-like protein